MNPAASAQPDGLGEYLEVAAQFRLGDLVTESPHPGTRELSRLAGGDPAAALEALKAVDLAALDALHLYTPELVDLAGAIGETLASGGRLFLCGCGATGRLSIALEVFSRQGLLGSPLASGAVAGFMAGGDCAMVRSIESFEDYPEFGARQLQELGFRDGDLLVATTEGGETPFVIGAAEAAAEASPSNSPYFLYCNPDEVLARVAERSLRVLDNPDILKINLSVGPMALTGSTRMQASTALMAAVGWAIDCRNTPAADALAGRSERFRNWVADTDFSPLAAFVEEESAAYQDGGTVLYEAAAYGLTALTDTTERSPTFSLTPFENRRRGGDPPSLCYLSVPGAPDARHAWRDLLGREPRTLEWGGHSALTGIETLLGFDFSSSAPARDADPDKVLHFTISDLRDGVRLRLGALAHDIPAAGAGLFARHLMLKLWLNMHSTLVMGRLGRYEGNLMTYVSPTNNKLIDRAIRYVRILMERRGGGAPSYRETAAELFRQRGELRPDEPIVLKTVRALEATRRATPLSNAP